MGKLLNALVQAANESITSSMKDFNEAIVNFDFNTEIANMKNRMNATARLLNREVAKLQKHVKNHFDKFEVEVNFNQDEDVITTQIKDGNFIVKVVKESNGHETTFTTNIPEEVIVESLVQKYNPETKKAIFTFSKKVS